MITNFITLVKAQWVLGTPIGTTARLLRQSTHPYTTQAMVAFWYGRFNDQEQDKGITIVPENTKD